MREGLLSVEKLGLVGHSFPYVTHLEFLRDVWIRNQCWDFKQYMGARNRAGIGLSYWPARLHSLVELVPWNRFLGSLKV
jgi:hypothetical protein